MSWARSAARCASLLLPTVVLFAAAPAGAGTFSVRAGALSFPAYDATVAGGTRATALASITCEQDCPAQVTVRLGEGMLDESPTQHRMSNSARPGTLSYQLSLEADNGSPRASLAARVQPGVPITFRITGVILPGQDAAIGVYHDRVTVLIDW